MLTVLLEVKNKNHPIYCEQFYNPAVEGFKRYPRTESGIQKTIAGMIKLANSNDWISDYQFTIYKGQYEYYKKDIEKLCTISRTGEQVSSPN